MANKKMPVSMTGLRERVRELEAQLESRESIQEVIENLQTYQEELRTQHEDLLHAQRELELSRDSYAELYDFAPVPILALSPKGLIEAMNLAAAVLIGVDRAVAVGTPFVVYVQAGSRHAFLDHMVRVRHETGVVRSEIVLASRHGDSPTVEIQTRVLERGGARQLVYQTALIDVTDARRMQGERERAAEERERSRRQELEARAASEAKDRFLAVLSHELRTPLTPILLTLETLGDSETSSVEQHRGLDAIRRNTELMAHLVDDLLDVTRIVHDKLHLSLAPVAMDVLLRSAVEMSATELEQRGLELDLKLDAGDIYVLGDALRLRQIFWNLLRNAIQHTPQGGRVAIRSALLAGGWLRVVVSDSGDGIEPRELERVFEPFRQSDKAAGGGLGLGLAICRGLAEAHGGTIRADSGRPEISGASFIVDLPTCPAPKSLPRSQLEKPAATHAPLRILVVEDHVDTAEAMQLVLQRLGYKVRLAHSVEEGRTLAHEPFDVLISDLQLPDGSGLDLMRELSAEHVVKGIAMSGFGTEVDVQRSREAGFHTHLVKPVDVHRVAEAIDALADG
jgi:signal transduction histidine kinase